MTTPLLDIQNVSRRFALRRGWFQPSKWLVAVDRVSVSVPRGRSLGIVGESGSGKSTLARMIMALDRPNEGAIRLEGTDLHALTAADLWQTRRQFQMVFQDPRGSLDPRMTVERIVGEPLEVAAAGLSRAGRRERIAEVLSSVGLGAASLDRYPHEFSGGQRQRIAIARALITRPALVVADEPVSALDVSVQAQVLNLMMDMQEAFGITYVFISHDLAVVEHIADDVIVMYRGRVVEQGPAEDLFQSPAHPYTRALVEAVAEIGHRSAPVSMAVVDGDATSGGCAYAGQCPLAGAECRAAVPELRSMAGTVDRRVACFKA
jgi:peptide/nickel transport system ATP-binding protein